MDYVHTQRLRRLATLLRGDAKKKKGIKFDLNFWGVNPKKLKKLPISCGTSACAMGLASISGIFKDEGLGYTTPALDSMGRKKGYFITPTFEGEQGFYAAKRFFGISMGEAKMLFNPGDYDDRERKGAKGELRVAQRIDDFILFKDLIPD